MNTRKALSNFTGRDTGETFLSDPRAVERFSRAAAARQEDILEKQRQPYVSMPHARLAAEKAAEANRTALLSSTEPLVDKFSAYQTAKKAAAAAGSDGGIRSLAAHLRTQWESDPDGFYSASDLVHLRDHYSRSFGRSAAIAVLSEDIPQAGVGNMPIRRLAQLAQQIYSQADYEKVCRQAGIDGKRPDQVRARAYVRSLVRRAAEAEAEGGDPMEVTVNEQQGAQLSGIPAGDGGSVLGAADLQVRKARKAQSACQVCAGAGVDAAGVCPSCKGEGGAVLPSEKQVTAAILDANVVKIAGFQIFINNKDQVELRTPSGKSRLASISRISHVVRDFLVIAQRADFEPSVNYQQEPYISISETEGGDVLGKDSASDEKATDAILPSGKPGAQHPSQRQQGTSASDDNLGADTSGNDPSWGNPALSGAHASDPHNQNGSSFSDRNMGPDRQQDEPAWGNPKRSAGLDDTPFLSGGDPAERYRLARENRPSKRLLAGIGDEGDWLARRVLAQLGDVEPDGDGDDNIQEAEPAENARMAVRTSVQLRDDVQQIGDGFQDRTADSKFVYTFGYDKKLGQPRMQEMQRYVDACCGNVRAYRVASTQLVSEGVIRAIVVQAQAEDHINPANNPDSKRTAVRRAMGRIITAEDFGNDPEGMAEDYEGTLLNKEGASGHYCEKCKVTHREKTKCPRSNAGGNSSSGKEPSAPSPKSPPAGEGAKAKMSPVDLGAALHQWTDGSGPKDPIYGAASMLYAGKTPPPEAIEDALDGLGRMMGQAESGMNGWGPAEVKELHALTENLNALLPPVLQHPMGPPPGEAAPDKKVKDLTNRINDLKSQQQDTSTDTGWGDLPASMNQENDAKIKALESERAKHIPGLLNELKQKKQENSAGGEGWGDLPAEMDKEYDQQIKELESMMPAEGGPAASPAPAPAELQDIAGELLAWSGNTGSPLASARRSLSNGKVPSAKVLTNALASVDKWKSTTDDPTELAELDSISKKLTGLQATPGPDDPATEAAPIPPPSETAKIKGKGIKFNDPGRGFSGKDMSSASGDFEVPGYNGTISVTQGANGSRSTNFSGKKPPSFKQTNEAMKQFMHELAKHPQSSAHGFGPSRNAGLHAPKGWADFLRIASDEVSGVTAPIAPSSSDQTEINPVTGVPVAHTGARITEGWGDGGDYKRDVEAETAQEVWELHKGLGGNEPQFKQQQEAQVAPLEPRPDAAGKVNFPEPEPETLNAEQEPQAQPAPRSR